MKTVQLKFLTLGCVCWVGLLSSAPVANGAGALLSDRGQPFALEADSAEYSDVTQTARFKGQVVLTQGSMRIQADTVETLVDPEGYQFATAKATGAGWVQFEQKSEGSNEVIRARAKQLLYDGKHNVIVLAGQARAQRMTTSGELLDQISAQELTYNQLTEVFETNSNERGRTHIVIAPRNRQLPAANPPANLSNRSSLPKSKVRP